MNTEIDIIAGIWQREDIRSELVCLDPNLFIKHRDFFEKTVKFHSGEYVKMDGYWDLIQNFKEYQCPPKTDKIINQLKREYVEDKISKSKLTSKEDLEKILADVYSMQEVDTQTIDDCITEILLERSEGKINGIQTGIQLLDENTIGLKGCHFWIIGGYTSVGKTQFSLDILKNIAAENLVHFYSLEMSKKDIILRLMKMFELKYGERGVDELRKLKLKVFHDKHKLEQIESHLITSEEKPKVVFIDFIQNIRTDDKSEYERLTNVSLSLQSLALKNNICIVALSQVSNESANSDKKTMGFKGSGAIAAACDVGIELFRNKDEQGLQEVKFTCKIRKNRHGKTAETDFEFNKSNGQIIF